MSNVRYFEHEFIDKSETSSDKVRGKDHYRGTFDEYQRLVRHEKVDGSGKVLQTTDFRYSKNFLSAVTSDSEGKVKSRHYDLFGDKLSWYSPTRVIFDSDGQVVYPIKTKPEPKKLKVMAARKVSPDMDFYENFKDLEGQEIQLDLPRRKDMLYIDNEKLRKTFKDLGITVKLMHGPDMDIFQEDFAAMLGWVRGNYGIDTMVLHPWRGDFENATALFEEKRDELGGLGLKLSYENLSNATDRWIKNPEDVMKVEPPFITTTLDISHLHPTTDLMSLEEKLFPRLDVVHLSNVDGCKRHVPYREGTFPTQEFLGALRSKGYKGYIVLEYTPEHKDKLLTDLHKVREFFG